MIITNLIIINIKLINNKIISLNINNNIKTIKRKIM